MTFQRIALILLFAGRAALSLGAVGPAQRPSTADQQTDLPGREPGSTSVIVHVRTSRGTQLLVPAYVHLYSKGGGFSKDASTGRAGEAVFRGVPLGTYTAEVSAVDHLPAQEQIHVQASGSWVTAVVILTPLMGTGSAPVEVTSAPLPEAPFELQRELNEAILEMRANKTDDARRRLLRAAKKVPGNPDPHYLQGALALQLQDLAQARIHLEKAVALSPGHARALAVLGDVAVRQGKDAEAIRLLSRSLDLEPNNWQAQALLATALFNAKQYETARLHAERALDLCKSSSPEVRLLVAQTLLSLKDNDAAAPHLEAFLKQWPRHPKAAQVRELLNAGATVPSAVPNIHTAAPEPYLRGWAPPDVDETAAPTATDVPCVLPAVLEAAAVRARALVENLQRISARETIEHTLLGKQGEPKRTETRRFNYIVTIRQLPPSWLSVDEMRDGPFSASGYSSGMSATGLPVMALVFHPLFASDYEMWCEGLAEWNGQPAWVVHFRHRPDRKNYFFGYVTPEGDFPVKLKGRAWLSTRSSDVIRMETDLAEAVPAAHLTRNRLTIEYRPQDFAGGSDPIWLPSRAELFSEVRGIRCRIQHTFRDFHLFSVATEQKINTPTPPQVVKEP